MAVNEQIDSTIEQHDAVAVHSEGKRSTPLYVASRKVYPKAVSGYFRNLKWILTAIFLGVYYITPWIRWDRGEHAPNQAVLVDILHRRFYFFGIEIWPQEFYYVAGLLIMGGVGLFLITSVAGRAWCGYACWQTVWTDLFLVVERWVEGDRNARIRLENGPWTASRVAKFLTKNVLWLLIALATGGAWIFYFADAPTLLKSFFTGQAPFVAYATVGVLTFTTFVFAGYMREQVCIYMCPWPRIQSAMFDENSLLVTYNAWRGEPRSLHRKKALAAGQKVGDCVDCNACVAVCPTGIDIREGSQLGCITCALCIDACNEVMDKMGLPRGLISYSNTVTYNDNAAGKPTHLKASTVFRPRTLIYFTVWSLAGLLMMMSLFTRERLDVNIVPDRNPLYTKLSDGGLRNGYQLKILNMKQQPLTFRVEMQGLAEGSFAGDGLTMVSPREATVNVEADKLKNVKIYVTMPPNTVKSESSELAFKVTETGPEGDGESLVTGTVFHGPKVK